MPSTVKQLEWNGSTEVLAKYAERDTKGRKISEIEGLTVINLPSTNKLNLWELDSGTYLIKPNTSASLNYGAYFCYFYFKTDSSGTPLENYNGRIQRSVTASGIVLTMFTGSTTNYSGGNKMISKYFVLEAGTDTYYGYTGPMYNSSGTFLYATTGAAYQNEFYNRVLAYYGDRNRRFYKHTITLKTSSTSGYVLKLSIINTEQNFGATYEETYYAPTRTDQISLLFYASTSNGCFDIEYYNGTNGPKPAKVTSVNYNNNTLTFSYTNGTSTNTQTTLDLTVTANLTVETSAIDNWTMSYMTD